MCASAPVSCMAQNKKDDGKTQLEEINDDNMNQCETNNDANEETDKCGE